MDDGPQQVENMNTLMQVRRQARRVYIQSLGWGVLLTVIAVLIPV